MKARTHWLHGRKRSGSDHNAGADAIGMAALARSSAVLGLFPATDDQGHGFEQAARQRRAAAPGSPA
jgi:hypothetical protein